MLIRLGPAILDVDDTAKTRGKSPSHCGEIPVAEIVNLLEGGINLSDCVDNPHLCNRADTCVARHIWESATAAMYDKLDAITWCDLMNKGKGT